MKKPFLSLTKLSLLTWVGVGFASLFIPQVGLAQFNSVDRGTNQNSDPFASPNSGDLNMFDLIHRVNMGNIQWNPTEQKEQIDSAALEFKARQQKAFQEQQNKSNPDSLSNLPPETPLP